MSCFDHALPRALEISSSFGHVQFPQELLFGEVTANPLESLSTLAFLGENWVDLDRISWGDS